MGGRGTGEAEPYRSGLGYQRFATDTTFARDLHRGEGGWSSATLGPHGKCDHGVVDTGFTFQSPDRTREPCIRKSHGTFDVINYEMIGSVKSFV